MRNVHLAFALGAAFASLTLHTACKPPAESAGGASRAAVPRVVGAAARAPLSDTELTAVGTVARDVLAGRPVSREGLSSTLLASTEKPSALVSVELRASGLFVHRGFAVGSSLVDAIEAAMRSARDAAGARVGTVDAILLNVGHDFAVIEGRRNRQLTNTRSKGTRGLELAYGGEVQVIPPTQMVEENASFEGYAERFAKRVGASVAELKESGGYRVFDSDQIYVKVSGEPVATRMIRGNTLVTMESLDKVAVTTLTESLAGWMFENLMDDGRMTYLYEPRAQREPKGNNMIRQWMGTIAMTRWAKRQHDDALLARVEKNIAYNLERFFKAEGDEGYIEYEGTSKLGANALAALAIVEHPARAKFKDYEDKLVKGTYTLFDEGTGRFKPFFKPRSQDGKNLHNFYPGETLLLWSFLYEESRDPQLLERLMKGFRHYREWHLKTENRKPAFVPWQAQAAYKVWRINQDPFLKDFIFEISDWLITEMQDGEWARAERDGYPDHMGRFFSSKRPDFFGPPHSASTGVYLEGLIDAHQLARAVGDAAREERYRQSIMRGIRSTMQLTFLDEIDMYYSTDRKRLRGGVRSRADRNTIRVDNVQHNMMGLMKILDGFNDGDYRP